MDRDVIMANNQVGVLFEGCCQAIAHFERCDRECQSPLWGGGGLRLPPAAVTRRVCYKVIGIPYSDVKNRGPPRFTPTAFQLKKRNVYVGGGTWALWLCTSPFVHLSRVAGVWVHACMWVYLLVGVMRMFIYLYMWYCTQIPCESAEMCFCMCAFIW